MKTTFKFIIAALSAIAVFSSCQKELTKEIATNTTDGLRVITVQFDNPTKASLGSDGFTPKFANGDKIRVSDSDKSEECAISVDGSGKAAFSTNLTGTLTAIYPAEAANYTPGTPDGPIVSPYFKVPASQKGDIANAIIAKAEIAAGSSNGTFGSQIALFQITPPDGVKEFTITSLKTVVSGARTGNAVPINTTGETDAKKLVIEVSNNALTTFYVALKADVNLSDLSFEYTETDGVHGAMKGISTKAITAAEKTDKTAANTKYTINNQDWHQYVKIGDLKWATTNIGADTPYGSGRYFAWGDVVGQTWSGTAWSGNGFSSAPDIGSNPTTLPTSNDAAFANWGGAWRMPTGGVDKELMDLFVKCVCFWTDDYKGSNVPGYIVYTANDPKDKGYAKMSTEWKKWNSTENAFQTGIGDYTPTNTYNVTSDAHIFFPAAGFGNGEGRTTTATLYWSSSIDQSNNSKANQVNITSTGIGLKQTNDRKYGNLIRPVSDCQ